MYICLIARNSGPRRVPRGPAPCTARAVPKIPQAVRVLQWRTRSLDVGLTQVTSSRTESPASSPAPSPPAAAASAVASAFVWLLLDAHLLLGGGLLDAEPLAADHGTVHRLRCTRSALAIAVPPPQYLLLPTIHYSLLNYSLATHFTIPASPCQPPRPWRKRRTRSPCSPG